MPDSEPVLVFVELLDEGTPTMLGVQAAPLGNDTYQLPNLTYRYDPEIECWEFQPGSVVRCERRMFYNPKDIEKYGEHYWLAVEDTEKRPVQWTTVHPGSIDPHHLIIRNEETKMYDLYETRQNIPTHKGSFSCVEQAKINAHESLGVLDEEWHRVIYE
jgi:hypothetical protein